MRENITDNMKRRASTQGTPTRKRARTVPPPQPRLLRSMPLARRAQLPATLRGSRFEIKACDYPVAASNPGTNVISTTSTFDILNGVQTGTAFNNRIGKKIVMRSLHFTGNIIFNAGNATEGGLADYLRIAIVYDRQPNGTFPAFQDLFLSRDNAGATTTSAYSPINMNNSDRFKILRDIRVSIPNNDEEASSFGARIATVIDYTNNRVNINEFIRLGNLETQYAASSNPAVVGDITTGALFVVTRGMNPAADSMHSLRWQARLRYSDS